MSLGQVIVISRQPSVLTHLCHQLSQLGFDCYPRTHCEDLGRLLLETNGSVVGLILDNPAELKDGFETLFALRHVFQRSSIPVFVLDETEAIQPFFKEAGLEQVYVCQRPVNGNSDEFLKTFLDHARIPFKTETVFSAYARVLEGDLSDCTFETLKIYLQQKHFTGVVLIQTPRSKTVLLKWQRGKIQEVIASGETVEQITEYVNQLPDGHFIVEQALIHPSDFHHFIAALDNPHELSLKDVFTDLFYFLYHIFQDKLDEEVIHQIFEAKFGEYRELFPALQELHFKGDSQEKFSFHTDIQGEQSEYLLMLFNDLLNELMARVSNYSFEDFIRDIDEISPYLKQFHLMEKILLKHKQPFSLT
ncbi:MAG: hypothetical protein GXO78_04615 [Calditrichaeota bacterium]|nr:hypothetical protein [Calditrichota bacterium]